MENPKLETTSRIDHRLRLNAGNVRFFLVICLLPIHHGYSPLHGKVSETLQRFDALCACFREFEVRESFLLNFPRELCVLLSLLLLLFSIHPHMTVLSEYDRGIHCLNDIIT